MLFVSGTHIEFSMFIDAGYGLPHSSNNLEDTTIVLAVLSDPLKTANRSGCGFISRMLDYMYQCQNCNKLNPPDNEHINPPLPHLPSLCVYGDKPVEADITVRPPASK